MQRDEMNLCGADMVFLFQVCATYLLQQLLSCSGEAKARMEALSEGEEDNAPLDLVLYDQQTQTPLELDATPCELTPSSQPILLPTEKTTAKALVNGQTVSPNCPMARLKRAMRCKQKSDASIINDSTNFIALLLEKLRKSEKFSRVLVLKGRCSLPSFSL